MVQSIRSKSGSMKIKDPVDSRTKAKPDLFLFKTSGKKMASGEAMESAIGHPAHGCGDVRFMMNKMEVL